MLFKTSFLSRYSFADVRVGCICFLRLLIELDDDEDDDDDDDEDDEEEEGHSGGSSCISTIELSFNVM